ncbi:MAG: GIY-YIG nuclease family protein [Methylococcaceae bacterium]|jgi:hypothetical protein
MNIVYVLTNPAMPGLVKIGFTASEDANSRIGQLYTTGVPVPFELEYACRVENGEEVEQALHTAFSHNRINSRREFFEIEVEQAVAILRLLHTEDATSDIAQQPSNVDPGSIEAANVMKARRPNLNFTEMGIPLGAELRSTTSDAVVTVEQPRMVRFGDEVMSLTAATREVRNLSYNVAPGLHWTYNGKLIKQIYDETYRNYE